MSRESAKKIAGELRRLPGVGAGWNGLRWVWNRWGAGIAIRRYMEAHAVRKLHIGASDDSLEGWLNADLFPTRMGVVRMDATKELPVRDGAFRFVFSEHMIEHISLEHGRLMLRQCHRVLEQGGRIRIATPDLRQVVRLRLDQGAEDVRRYLAWAGERLGLTDDGSRAAQVVNSLFHDHGHLFLYDEETLGAELRAAGFTEVRRCRCGESAFPELCGLEQHHFVIGEEANTYETLVMEAFRP